MVAETVTEGGEVVTFGYSGPLLAPDVRLSDVRWRVDSKPSNSRCRFVSYIDARTAAKYLDEWVGPDGWQEEYEEGTLFDHRVLWCRLAITFGSDVTVVHSDLSTFSKGRGKDEAAKMATGVKGVVSDAFKRVAAKAGIGRNVYELPEIWAPVRVDNNGTGWATDASYEAITAALRDAGHQINVTAARVDDTEEAASESGDAEEWRKTAKDFAWAAVGGPTVDRNDSDVYKAKAAEAFKVYGQAVQATIGHDPTNADEAATVTKAINGMLERAEEDDSGDVAGGGDAGASDGGGRADAGSDPQDDAERPF